MNPNRSLEDFLRNVINKFHRALTLRETLQVIVEEARIFLEVDRVKVYKFAADGSGEVLAEAVDRTSLPSLLGLHFPADDIPPHAREELGKQKKMIAVDVAHRRKKSHDLSGRVSSMGQGNGHYMAVDSCHIQYLLAMGVLSSLTVPVMQDQQLWGIMAVHHSKPRRFTEQEWETMALLSKEVSLAITQSQLSQQVHQQQVQEALVQRLERTVAQYGDRPETWQYALEIVGQAMEADGGVLYIAPDLTGSAAQHYQWNLNFDWGDWLEMALWQELMRGKPNPTSTLASVQSSWEKPKPFTGVKPLPPANCVPQVYTLSELEQRGDWVALEEPLKAQNFKSFLMVPLAADQQWVGGLILLRKEQSLVKHWAGKRIVDRRNMLPRLSFEAWEETQKLVPTWSSAERKLAQVASTQLYMAITQQFVTRLITQQTAYDPLTQLPNWIIFNRQLTLALLDALYEGKMVGVLVIAMDRFKRINESFGHKTGDGLLQEVADRLNQKLLPLAAYNPLLSRWHGDGFTILLTKISDNQEMIPLCERLLGTFQEPFFLQGQPIYLTASMGISTAPYDGETAESLLKFAEIALTRAKCQGKNTYQFYRPQDSAPMLDRLTLESDLRQALTNEEFVLYFQPQVALDTGKLVGVEALVRWQHPRLGQVAPDVFIPLAEELGLINHLGQWVLETACTTHQHFYRETGRRLRMAVNISARQFQDEKWLNSVLACLKRTAMPPEDLELEITESLMMEDIKGTVTLLHCLQEEGVQVAIDDFGTGYSSLSILKQLPIHRLKIDKSFVDDLLNEGADTAIIQYVIDLANGLNLEIVAEGIESEAQLQRLRKMGCHLGQGYFLTRPLPAEAMMTYLFYPQILDFGPTPPPPHPSPAETESDQCQGNMDVEDAPLPNSLNRENPWTEKLHDYVLLKERLQQRNVKEKLVLKIANKIRASLNINDILHSTVTEVRQFLNTDRVVLFKFNSQWSGRVQTESHNDFCQSIINQEIDDPCFKGHYLRLYREGRVRAISDIEMADLAECHRELLRHYQVKANLVVPVVFNENLWGLLIAHECKSPRYWQEDDLQLLMELATQVAIAIHQGELYEQLEASNIRLQQISSLDALTQVGNRYLFDSTLEREWQRLQRGSEPLALLLCDVDFFKGFNDNYGHPAGDRCLKEIANAMAKVAKRPTDLVARYGGEEFAVILSQTDLEGAIHVTKALQAGVANLAVPHSESDTGYVTLSIGIAVCVPDRHINPNALVKAADLALYEAKAKGRNQWRAYEGVQLPDVDGEA
ncbi:MULTISPECIES: diguanylate cyclase domain-containing protein [unclassified Synechocystis]|uniref:diguanylate cyclase domain-containing protein n=1 Tax=unclassified Synechocystis TaxID=2640012 RepID=UPI000416417D|nr:MULTISPECIES: diguanylate cyclase [unclassified Synechocystis]AIE73515.1 diguanylate cyclase/phosphodiesterase (GGDEF & EAL domains) with PAS/PAC sensor(s) [Synechocystis sp. PCC 6714]MCT0254137.1 diguanylate cyclase [Synechocystis sp. CS-94]